MVCGRDILVAMQQYWSSLLEIWNLKLFLVNYMLIIGTYIAIERPNDLRCLWVSERIRENARESVIGSLQDYSICRVGDRNCLDNREYDASWCKGVVCWAEVIVLWASTCVGSSTVVSDREVDLRDEVVAIVASTYCLVIRFREFIITLVPGVIVVKMMPIKRNTW